MVSGKHKSGRLARVHKVTPGARTKLTFRRRKPKSHKCSTCGTALSGISRLTISAAKNTAKSKKTVQRAYGGCICAGCLRQKLKEEARHSSKINII
jgi:ribosomal protein L34E